MLKGSNRSRLWSKLAGISHKVEGGNMMEKDLRVFRARSHIYTVKPPVSDHP